MRFQDQSSHHLVLKHGLELEKIGKQKTKDIPITSDVFCQPGEPLNCILTPHYLHARWSCCPYGPAIVRSQDARSWEAGRKLEVFKVRGRKARKGK
jgi:hypothetical protein